MYNINIIVVCLLDLILDHLSPFLSFSLSLLLLFSAIVSRIGSSQAFLWGNGHHERARSSTSSEGYEKLAYANLFKLLLFYIRRIFLMR